MSDARRFLVGDGNATLTCEYPRVLRDYAQGLEEQASDRWVAHVAYCHLLAQRLEVVARRERPLLAWRDTHDLHRIRMRLFDASRSRQILSMAIRVNLAQGMLQLKALAVPLSCCSRRVRLAIA